MTKTEIERELAGKGDYVLIDNITRFLKESLPMDMKKFLYSKIVVIYERRKMFANAADIYARMAEISLNQKERVDYFVKETECYIKAGFLDKADNAIRRVIGGARASERAEIMISIKEFYKNQAEIYEKEKRRNRAVKIYEKLLTLNISDAEKDDINKKLLGLYKELGMIKEYMCMKEKLE